MSDEELPSGQSEHLLKLNSTSNRSCDNKIEIPTRECRQQEMIIKKNVRDEGFIYIRTKQP